MCTQQTLAHPSKMSLGNSSKIDNFPICQKYCPYYNWKTGWNNNNKNKQKNIKKKLEKQK